MQVRPQRLSTLQQERLNSENPEETEAQLQQDRESHQVQRAVQLQTPLFEQPSVRAKMASFHSQLATFEVSKCATCLENFPGASSSAGFAECVRCHCDNRIPKLYSSASNMNPGPVPPELQVSALQCDSLPGMYMFCKVRSINHGRSPLHQL